MDGFSLTSSLFKSLAWPITTLLILYFGKDDIINFVKSIKTLNFDKIGLKIDILADDLAENTETLAKEENVVPQPEQYEALDTGNLFTTLISTYSNLEKELKATLSRKIDDGTIDSLSLTTINGKTVASKNIPIHLVLRSLVRAGLIDEEFQQVFNDLRTLRNIVVHEAKFDISDESAKKLISSSVSLTNILKKI